MIKLHLGEMTNEELANWFGVKEKTFTNAKRKKLEELKNFAEFEESRGKVKITKIIEPIYKKKRKESYQKIKAVVDEIWNEDGLDSCVRVGLKIKEKMKNELAESTIYNYTRQSRNELYGIPFQGHGTLGSCIYVWCKKEGDGADAKYSLLTPEEEKIKQLLITKYFKNATEKQLFVKAMIARGEIKEEEAWGVLEDFTGMNGSNFMDFLSELQVTIGCQVIRGTLVNRDRIAFGEDIITIED